MLLQLNVVGDFNPEELEGLMLQYMGTLTPSPDFSDVSPHPQGAPVTFCFPPEEERRQTWHLPDSDERACANIMGPAPCRY
jgi:predicted Zn-dependent peptidase